MKKLLIIVTCFASLGLAACARTGFVHKIDIQQGNVVTREQVSRLESGMTRRQVRFIMGSPMVADVFHQDRWDYIYRYQPGYGAIDEDRVTLHFNEDALDHIVGTIRPVELTEAAELQPRQTTVVVPPYERETPGVLSKMWRLITFREPKEP